MLNFNFPWKQKKKSTHHNSKLRRVMIFGLQTQALRIVQPFYWSLLLKIKSWTLSTSLTKEKSGMINNVCSPRLVKAFCSMGNENSSTAKVFMKLYCYFTKLMSDPFSSFICLLAWLPTTFVGRADTTSIPTTFVGTAVVAFSMFYQEGGSSSYERKIISTIWKDSNCSPSLLQNL